MKRLLQVGQLVLWRHEAADLTRINVRIGRADYDLDRRVELTDLRRGPDAVGSGWHAHVQEHEREGLSALQALAYRRNRRGSLIAEHGLEHRGASRGTAARCLRTGLLEQPRAQLV